MEELEMVVIAEIENEKKKPRVSFCWSCGRKLYGNHYAEKEIDGHSRILHKDCAKTFDDPMPNDWQLIEEY